MINEKKDISNIAKKQGFVLYNKAYIPKREFDRADTSEKKERLLRKYSGKYKLQGDKIVPVGAPDIKVKKERVKEQPTITPTKKVSKTPTTVTTKAAGKVTSALKAIDKNRLNIRIEVTIPKDILPPLTESITESINEASKPNLSDVASKSGFKYWGYTYIPQSDFDRAKDHEDRVALVQQYKGKFKLNPTGDKVVPVPKEEQEAEKKKTAAKEQGGPEAEKTAGGPTPEKGAPEKPQPEKPKSDMSLAAPKEKEPPGGTEPDTAADRVKNIITVTGFRPDTSEEEIIFFQENDEGNAETVDAEKWKENYVGQNENGSAILGVLHVWDGRDNEIEHAKNNVIPHAERIAQKAIEDGKKVVHLREKDIERAPSQEEILDSDPMDGTLPEQDIVSQHLVKKFGDDVELDTWDGEDTSIHKPDSKVFDELEKITGLSKQKIKAALYYSANMEDESTELDGFVDPNDTETINWLKENGITDPLNMSDEIVTIVDEEGNEKKVTAAERTRGEAYKLLFPQDFGDEENEFGYIMKEYNNLRQVNMKKKVDKLESEGKVVIVTPGASHAYNLRDSFGKPPEEKEKSVSEDIVFTYE